VEKLQESLADLKQMQSYLKSPCNDIKNENNIVTATSNWIFVLCMTLAILISYFVGLSVRAFYVLD